MEKHVKSPLGFEKINFRSESISWDLTINNMDKDRSPILEDCINKYTELPGKPVQGEGTTKAVGKHCVRVLLSGASGGLLRCSGRDSCSSSSPRRGTRRSR